MAEQKNFPRVLVISNSCISQSDSNGRTLRNFLVGWDRDCLAQFYTNPGQQDFTVCHNYYNITDAQALNALIKGRKYDGRVSEPYVAPKTSGGSTKKTGRNALTMSIRNFVWNTKRWRGAQFAAWVDEFSPELILLQAGDCSFMLKLALELSKTYNAPLVVYNSECYYFKKFDYFKAKGLAHLYYPLFRFGFCRQFKKLMKHASQTVYNCEMLQREYDKAFGAPSVTVYTASEVTPVEASAENATFVTSYLGNLGVGRHEGLVQIAKALQRISPELYLDVYGKIPNEEVRAAFDGCEGIRYRGFVSYEDVVRIIGESDLLVHTENFSGFYRKDLQYAFSTKIADSLASGTPFLLYAPEEMACTEYLKKTEAAHLATNEEELFATLAAIVGDRTLCRSHVSRALEVARTNHSAERNKEAFQRVLMNLSKEKTHV